MEPSSAASGGLVPFVGFLVVVLAIGSSASLPVIAAENAAGASPATWVQTQVEPDVVFLSVTLRTDGSAGWRVEYRVRLDDANSTEAFESLQSDVEANRSAYVTRFEDRMRPIVQDAVVATGREMSLEDVSVSTTTQQLPQTYGVLVYTFDWTQFAVIEADRIRGGDALAGLFLDADSTLLISWPTDYSLSEVSPEPTEHRDRSVVWRGPTHFGPGEPDLVVSEAGGVHPDDEPSMLGIAVVMAVLVGGVVVWWWRGRRGRVAAPDSTLESGTGPADSDLLSNEERIVALLEEHGGRMKQQDLAESLGWTDAKTSQVVGSMRESGDLEGFRLGRENVLRLPDVDEEAVSNDES